MAEARPTRIPAGLAGNVDRAIVIDDIVAVVEQPRNMQGAAYETLLEAGGNGSPQ
jgi:hypothetical protein